MFFEKLQIVESLLINDITLYTRIETQTALLIKVKQKKKKEQLRNCRGIRPLTCRCISHRMSH